MAAIRWQHKPFAQLSLDELYGLLWLRDEVFVVGQGITAESEVDGLDPQCVHIWGEDETGRIVACARLFWHKDPIKVGRVAVHPKLQRSGLGSALMGYVHTVLGQRAAAMSAQAHLEPWYARLGWTRDGAVYDEAGIPHVHMTRLR